MTYLKMLAWLFLAMLIRVSLRHVFGLEEIGFGEASLEYAWWLMVAWVCGRYRPQWNPFDFSDFTLEANRP